MKTHTLPVALNDAELEEFGREMDAIREDTLDALGDKDRKYILRVIKLHRSMDFVSRMIIFGGLFFHSLWQHAWAGQTVHGNAQMDLGFIGMLGIVCGGRGV